MGIANIIPGVSGGTIAVVFGIYEDLMEALGNFWSNKDKRWIYIRYLIIIFSGSLTAVLLLSQLLSWALTNYEMITIYFFMGLILGSIPVVYKSHSDMKITVPRMISLIIGMGLVIILATLQSGGGASSGGAAIMNYGILNFLYILICGIIAASAMIVPGVSGSFILVLLGTYWVVLQSISKLTSEFFQAGLSPEMIIRLLIIGSLGIGIVVGILGFSRLMSWALKNYPAITMFAILGLIFGS